MTTSKRLCQYSICALVVLLLLFLTGISIYANDKYQPDQDFVKASFKKAEELKYNAIPIYLKSKGGNIIITAGAMFSIRNNQIAWEENDMAINVGEFPIPLGEVTLTKGEYAVVKNGKFVKQAGKITAN